MTTTAPDTVPRQGLSRRRGSFQPRRFASLVRGETRILVRNRTALFMSLAMPLLMAGMFMGLSTDMPMGAFLVTVMAGMSLLFVVYYTMVTSLVARREQLLLKRLRTGEATHLEILLAPAVPLYGLLLVQVLLGLLAAVFVLDASVPNPWAIAPAVVLGAAAWTGLAIWSANLTRTVESAQLTTLPALLVTLLLSGFSIPLALLPDQVQTIAHLLPLTPVVDLVNLAFQSTSTSGEHVSGFAALRAALGPCAVLVMWAFIGFRLGMGGFRWEPRS